MSLKHPSLEPFEPLLSQVMDLAFRTGINTLHSSGLKMEDINHNSSARNRFMRSCHYGYDRAQQKIGALVSDLQIEIDEKKSELKCLRRVRNKGGIKVISGLLAVLNGRQLILRRILDTILWSLLQRETWIVKRLIVENRIRPPDPKVISKTVKLASEWNKASRYRFYLVSDLTTFCQIGDLVGIDLTQESEKRWTVIELKEGKVNEILSGLIEGKTEPLSDEEYDQIKMKLNSGAAKQAKRMVNQQKRMKEFWNFVTRDKGVDPLIKKEVQLIPGPPVVAEDYDTGLRKIIDAATSEGAGAITIDKCLHLFATTSELLERENAKEALIHVFFHMVKPDFKCCLFQANKEEEIFLLKNFTPPMDLVAANVRALWGNPFFFWPVEKERLLDLAFGRIRVFCFFDIEQFFNMAKESGLKVSWANECDIDNEYRSVAFRIPGFSEVFGIKVEGSDGLTHILLSGFFARVINEQMRPNQLLDLILHQQRKGKEVLQKGNVTLF